MGCSDDTMVCFTKHSREISFIELIFPDSVITIDFIHSLFKIFCVDFIYMFRFYFDKTYGFNFPSMKRSHFPCFRR